VSTPFSVRFSAAADEENRSDTDFSPAVNLFTILDS
jgi:hypothetical protein